MHKYNHHPVCVLQAFWTKDSDKMWNAMTKVDSGHINLSRKILRVRTVRLSTSAIIATTESQSVSNEKVSPPNFLIFSLFANLEELGDALHSPAGESAMQSLKKLQQFGHTECMYFESYPDESHHPKVITTNISNHPLGRPSDNMVIVFSDVKIKVEDFKNALKAINFSYSLFFASDNPTNVAHDFVWTLQPQKYCVVIFTKESVDEERLKVLQKELTRTKSNEINILILATSVNDIT